LGAERDAEGVSQREKSRNYGVDFEQNTRSESWHWRSDRAEKMRAGRRVGKVGVPVVVR
jgi:hypothetical protein